MGFNSFEEESLEHVETMCMDDINDEVVTQPQSVQGKLRQHQLFWLEELECSSF